MNNILALETNKYALKLENFEGPLDLLCHLVDKNKMDISKVKISDIADQYIEYLNAMKAANLELTSEFVLMASTLLFIKSRNLLPKQTEDEAELTEEELISRIIEYKKYKEITKTLREFFDLFSKRFYKMPDKIELQKRKLETTYEMNQIFISYSNIIERNNEKVNKNASNIEKIAIIETVTVASKVKEIFKELTKKPKFVFSKLCLSKKYSKLETVTAFSGVLELTRKNKILANQEKNFGDITIEKVNQQT